MKINSKPISSPSRLDKFPPPLMRFLRNNGGSRSRGRSRSSPMFIRRRNEASASTEGPEPSSPKVTCMGQVRVKRANKHGRNRAKTGERKLCVWIRKALFCNRKAEPRGTSRPFWERWFVPFRVGCRKKSKERESKREETEEYAETGGYEEETEEYEENERDKVFVSCSPPKNALLLMRCKSEPSRAPSLAYHFWAEPSALEVEKTEQDQTCSKHQEEEEVVEEEEPICGDSAAESRTDPENKVYIERLESSSNNKTSVELGEESSRREIARPLMLPRCKSEPARRPERLDPESWFWKRRLNLFEMPTTTRF